MNSNWKRSQTIAEYYRRYCPVCTVCKRTKLVHGSRKKSGICGKCEKKEKTA